jgi:hypothetical protein
MATQNYQSDAFARTLSAPVEYSELNSVDLGISGMDYHGQGLPTASVRQLARRRREDNVQTLDGEGVLIGLVDGPFTDHPWLDGSYLASPNEFESFFPLCDEPFTLPSFAGHATFITGLILQQAPAAGVWVEKVVDHDGTANAADVLTAVRTLADRGVQIVNLSLGCFDEDATFTSQMQAAFHELREDYPWLVVVAAAGNLPSAATGEASSRDASRRFWPAACDDVIGVGAVSGDDATDWADWSSKGSWIQFAANGKDLLSTYLDRTVVRERTEIDFNGWATWSGTSFSAAIVTGAIARTMTDPITMTKPLKERARIAVESLQSKAEVRIGDDQTPVVPRERFGEQNLMTEAALPSRAWVERYRRYQLADASS